MKNKKETFSQLSLKDTAPKKSARNLTRAKSNLTLFDKKTEFYNNANININPNPTIKNILNKMICVKKTNLKMSTDILSNHSSTRQKDKLITAVVQEAKQIEIENNFLKQTYDVVNQLKEKCDNEQKAVTEYHKTLSIQHAKYMKTIQMYESAVIELKNKEVFLEKSSMHKIERIGKAKELIEKDIKSISENNETQQNQIKELENEVETLLNQKEKDRIQIEENTIKKKKQLYNLQKKYEYLKKRVKDYTIKEEFVQKEYIPDEPDKNIYEIKEDLEIQLNEYKQQNTLLLETINHLKNQITLTKKSLELEKKTSVTDVRNTLNRCSSANNITENMKQDNKFEIKLEAKLENQRKNKQSNDKK